MTHPEIAPPMEPAAGHSEGYIRFLAWLEVNKTRLIVAVVIILLLAGGLALWGWMRDQRESKAALALSQVRMPMSPNDPVSGNTVDELRKVSREYQGTRAANRAELVAASVLFSEGKFVESEKAFEKYLSNAQGSQWTPQASFGMAASLEAQGKQSEAMAKYDEFLKRFPNDPAADYARLKLGRLYEANNKFSQAFETYSKVASSGGFSGPATEAQTLLRDLVQKHPEVTATNAAPATPRMVSPVPAPAPAPTPAPAPSATPAAPSAATPAPTVTPAKPVPAANGISTNSAR